MLFAMYEYADEFGKLRYSNAKIGGFKRESAAIAAIKRRSQVGYVTDSNSRILFIIRNGIKVS